MSIGRFNVPKDIEAAELDKMAASHNNDLHEFDVLVSTRVASILEHKPFAKPREPQNIFILEPKIDPIDWSEKSNLSKLLSRPIGLTVGRAGSNLSRADLKRTHVHSTSL